MEIDRRLMPRYTVGLRIVVGGMEGATRDIGVNGVSFVVPRALPVSQPISFSITLDGEPARLRLDCAGTVKRCERSSGGQFEVVATIERLDLQPLGGS